MNPKDNSNTAPIISVVMATFNGERFISEAIQSILDQTFKDFEFIIVDDGSTDNTAQVIHSFKDHRIIYVKKEINSGIADSLNAGIAKAKGKYIARMDDDDVSMPMRFEKQLRVLENDPNIIFCGTIAQDHSGKPIVSPEHHDDILLRLFFFRNPIFHPTALIRKSILLKHKYRPEMVPAEDHDLWSRLLFQGRFYQIQEPLLYVRLHQTSITARRRQEQLQHNVSISKFVHHKVGFKPLKNHDEHIRIMASHDYSIHGIELRRLIKWIKNLKKVNKKIGKFPKEKFNIVANECLKRFITSYFTSNKITKKAVSFLYLTNVYKIYIIKLYSNKL
ncbi:glycosyltransferase [Yeosuana sp. MJ-SS3]|uniref:Glycosyltransferase n=1 Tax=Gilvirhabdus luticola TaxID=3079858 RepID=A0ABU3U4Y9_9FLAO|nr:glycosyltransferase [Yeosuana sp. MJ-SS3]MDU8885474.1 glycosyltransferase [Yeosuana sp. MJ-SS3]